YPGGSTPVSSANMM
nr:Chain B, Casein kinase II subunit alpha [Homo sapiens]3PE4_D Chain D, Casein kinase II subunit alpha [Homo sapiens]3TAX_B Chain B, Casein kinase II subunit alpha [Homo sapiens]3TAX_D Chain D, Casein kinase II subunit alpha [Homo sapiens]4GYW_B Chain B, Casein kinase II subunit alpha [Homo sapiens]4GYW_D Chain D, Casein kinase II subunit alpha [Homo sapiens]4GYY_B Chain B, Casein kinase II subunit alpha [Homo sapiens]4GYY_D Chain D, Casein kinase II subunit alpha [Homo sapiens]4GZ3_B Chai